MPPAEIAVRRLGAMRLRRGGASYRAIAESLGVDVRTAYEDVQLELAAINVSRAEISEEVRELELERLDDMTLTATVQFRNGSVKAGELLVRIMERRARLLSLDGPLKVAPTSPSGDQPYAPTLDVASMTPEERALARKLAERALADQSAASAR